MKRAFISKNAKDNANEQMRFPQDHIMKNYLRVKLLV